MNEETMKACCEQIESDVKLHMQKRFAETEEYLMHFITEKTLDLMNNEEYLRLRQKSAELEERVNELERRLSELQFSAHVMPSMPTTPRHPAEAVDGIGTLSEPQMDLILSFPDFCIEVNNWVYYIKIVKDNDYFYDAHNYRKAHEGYGALYKVRPDGTENQKIFDGKVNINRSPSEFFYDAETGILHFVDWDERSRTIKV